MYILRLKRVKSSKPTNIKWFVEFLIKAHRISLTWQVYKTKVTIYINFVQFLTHVPWRGKETNSWEKFAFKKLLK